MDDLIKGGGGGMAWGPVFGEVGRRYKLQYTRRKSKLNYCITSVNQHWPLLSSNTPEWHTYKSEGSLHSTSPVFSCTQNLVSVPMYERTNGTGWEESFYYYFCVREFCSSLLPAVSHILYRYYTARFMALLFVSQWPSDWLDGQEKAAAAVAIVTDTDGHLIYQTENTNEPYSLYHVTIRVPNVKQCRMQPKYGFGCYSLSLAQSNDTFHKFLAQSQAEVAAGCSANMVLFHLSALLLRPRLVVSLKALLAKSHFRVKRSA